MAPSLRVVVRRMGLRPLAGTLDSAVRWVAVSELEDPTPFLEGGELLLTTGMRLEHDFSDYVARLVARGVAGLGFAVGLTHEDVPAELVEAASRAGLPLLEVPRETPFIAIGKTVSELLAAEQYDEIARAFAAQGRLTRAALRPEGMHAVVDRLAKEVGGWAALLDEAGEVRHATPGARVAAVAPELSRLRGGHAPGESGAPEQEVSRQGPRGGSRAGAGRSPAGTGRAGQVSAGRLPASLAISGPGGQIIVQPLGGGARPRGFFAVGAAHAFSPVSHTVINAAGSLLTLALEQGGAQREGERRVRSAVLALLLGGETERAREVLETLGARTPEEPLVVLAAGGEALDALEPHAFAARLGEEGPAVALVTEETAEKVAAQAGGSVGMSAPCAYSDLRGGLDQARRALQAGRGGVVRFAELAGQGVLKLLDPAAAQAFGAALLAPLVRYGSRADLVDSLRAYLDSNGHWDAAAQRLGIHRHTLRYRMKRVAELLGRDLDDPGVRAELWIALAATASATSAPESSRSSPS
ncbi:PucR family transcriptional regulator ligand-binding domain-containing protein [Nonomuraea sp. NPDC048916]|uniref:PucR family transcriptional regulator ligand-binding domain-containing protein n=1 Tax=Nonomuraea sp. NPDC048916 TaxID=3154232 RepID=UPI0033C301C0